MDAKEIESRCDRWTINCIRFSGVDGLKDTETIIEAWLVHKSQGA